MKLFRQLADFPSTVAQALQDAYISWYGRIYGLKPGDLVTNTREFYMSRSSPFLMPYRPDSVSYTLSARTPMVCIRFNGDDAVPHYVLHAHDRDMQLPERLIIYVRRCHRTKEGGDA